MHGRMRKWALAGSLAAPSLACSVNPATGRVQAFLVSDAEEIELGRTSDAEITESMRTYDEAPELTALVKEVGAKLADKSERPGLPWTFRLLDEAGVNAFALPGGFVYVTRGLLTHLNSEDELAAVLGHEAGHVTARHGAVKLRKTSVARRSVGVFRVVDPGLRHIGGLAASAAGLALLKYSRDDEYEADDLALRYVRSTGYDPAGVPEVFSVLSTVAETQGQVPAWLSTHPEPELRRKRVADELGVSGREGVDEDYLALLEGVVHGRDARDGFMLAQRYVQPRAGFTLTVPEAWETALDSSSLVALAPDKNGLLVLGPSDESSAAEALDKFFADTQTARGETWEGKVGGFAVVTAAFTINGSDGGLSGLAAFFDYGDQVIAILAAAEQAAWPGYADAVGSAVASFRELKDGRLRKVEPTRIHIDTLPVPMTLAAYNKDKPSAVSLLELARINHVQPDATLPLGRKIKRVDGFNADVAEAAAEAEAKGAASEPEPAAPPAAPPAQPAPPPAAPPPAPAG